MQLTMRAPTATLGKIPSGDAGTRITLRLMSQLVRAHKKHYPIRQLALNLVRSAPQKDWMAEIDRLHRYVRDRIRYVKDIKGVETLATPTRTLEIGQGDCDDKSTLLATLLESIGHPTRFVAIAVNGGPRFCHVYVETKARQSWIPLETTEPWPAGVAAPGITRRLVVEN